MNWSYLAGFIDGEGSVLIHNKSNDKRVIISIPNTNKAVIESIKSFLCCGKIWRYDRNPNKWKPVYIYNLSEHKKVSYVLKKLKPFLIVKRKKCDQAIEFIKNKKWRGEGGIFDVTPNELIKMKESYSLRYIGKKYGCSHITVKNLLYKYRN